MPNWCNTKLTVSGPTEEIDKFISGLKRDDNGILIMDSYLPCPEELRETVDGWSSDEEEQKKREELYASNIAKYGYKSWYDWQYSVWGTKWGDCDTTMGQSSIRDDEKVVEFYYQTAWGPMTNGFVEISKRFPNLLFLFAHDEEGGFFAGYEAIKDGNVWEHMYEPSEYPKEVDWDDDDEVNAFYAWKDAMMESCESAMTATIGTIVRQ